MPISYGGNFSYRHGRYVEFNASKDSIVMRKSSTGENSLMSIDDDYGILNIDVISPSPYQNSGNIRTPQIAIASKENGSSWFDVAVSGDVNMFTKEVFSDYSIGIVRDGDVVIESDEILLGIGLEYEYRISSSEMYVTRNPSIKEKWIIEFRLFEEETSTRNREATVIFHDVENHSDRAKLTSSIAQWDVDPGEYRGVFQIFENELDRKRDSNTLISMPMFDTITIT